MGYLYKRDPTIEGAIESAVSREGALSIPYVVELVSKATKEDSRKVRDAVDHLISIGALRINQEMKVTLK